MARRRKRGNIQYSLVKSRNFTKLAFSVLFLFTIVIFVGCSTEKSGVKFNYDEKFVPTDRSVWLIAGQDLEAVGGLDKYNDGFVEYVGIPAGFTTYTNLFNLQGINSLVNYGAGDVHAKKYLNDKTFNNAIMVIGLHLINDIEYVVAGYRDENLEKLGEFIKSYKKPVFLRIGYEFDGEWNGYDPIAYREAFKYIVDRFREMGVDNCVTVWQSSGYNDDDRDFLMKWYPGDDYVDWLGFSLFDQPLDKVGSALLELGREKGKPVIICESAPKRDNLLGDGEEILNNWYIPVFDYIYENKDVIKGFAYINARWDDQTMWAKQGGWGDSRIQVSGPIYKKWMDEMNKDSGKFWAITLASHPKKFVLPDNFTERKREYDAQRKTVKGAYEAENAELIGSVRTYSDVTASNGLGVGWFMSVGDMIVWHGVKATEHIKIRYASPNRGSFGVYVNGEKAATFSFRETGGWSSNYNQLHLKVSVPEGADFSLRFESDSLSCNIDYVLFD